MERRAIIIDTDPGQDDALALMLAFARADALDVRLVTTVAGNVEVEKTTLNALRIRDLAGRPDVPVHQGAACPLVVPLETAAFVCGEDGLAGAGLPPPASHPAPGHAVDAIIAEVRRAEPGTITLCALGPLTNIALALRLAPDIAPRLAGIVMMGGAMGLGNITPAAEFNVWVDPHAASIVLEAGVPVTLFGLNVTLQAIASDDQMRRLEGMASATGLCVHGMLARPRPGGLGTHAHPMHDPCVIAWLLWPELFDGRPCRVDVEREGSLRGRTTIDWNNRMKRAPNALVIGSLDAAAMFDRMIDALETLP
jgi:purine nucleosidase